MSHRVSCILGILVFLTASIAMGAEIGPQDQESLNLSLRREAIAGNIQNIERLLAQGADINSKAPFGESALEYAIRFGRYTAALKLLQRGADPNSEDDSGLSPLLRAAKKCDASRVVDALLRAGARVNHRDGSGQTALINAAHADCVRNVAVLLLRAKSEIEIDAQNDVLQSASSLAQEGFIPELLDKARQYQRDGLNGPLSTPLKKLR